MPRRVLSVTCPFPMLLSATMSPTNKRDGPPPPPHPSSPPPSPRSWAAQVVSAARVLPNFRHLGLHHCGTYPRTPQNQATQSLPPGWLDHPELTFADIGDSDAEHALVTMLSSRDLRLGRVAALTLRGVPRLTEAELLLAVTQMPALGRLSVANCPKVRRSAARGSFSPAPSSVLCCLSCVMCALKLCVCYRRVPWAGWQGRGWSWAAGGRGVRVACGVLNGGHWPSVWQSCPGSPCASPRRLGDRIVHARPFVTHSVGRLVAPSPPVLC